MHSYFMLVFALRSPLLRYYWVGWEKDAPGFLQDFDAKFRRINFALVETNTLYS